MRFDRLAHISKLNSDLLRLARVCGPNVALQYLSCVCRAVPKILARGDLQPADRLMGEGPFEICLAKHGCQKFLVKGPGVFTGIREMYVRDVYLRGGILAIEPGDVVLDLGANMGNFTNLALAAHPMTRVIAVEPPRVMAERFKASVGLNDGFLNRVRFIRAFAGDVGEKLQKIIYEKHEEYEGAIHVSEEDLLSAAGNRIDFLKCDIEGGEFGLLGPNSKLLRVARKVACEVHAFAGDVERFLAGIRESGFDILFLQRDPDGTATFLAKRVR